MLEINFTPFPILTTDRLVLRQLEPSDDLDIYSHRSDEGVNRYLDGFKHTSLEETQAFINRVRNEITNTKTILWVLSLKGNNKFMGTICLWNISKEDYKAELGYTICAEYQRNGYMGEALEKVIDFGFNKMKLRTIEAFTHNENVPSIKLLVRNNFKLNNTQEMPNKKNRIMFSLTKEIK